MKADYKGHNSLAEMVSTHIHVWRDLLQDERDRNFEESSYYEHELKALAEIEAAVNAELECK